MRLDGVVRPDCHLLKDVAYTYEHTRCSLNKLITHKSRKTPCRREQNKKTTNKKWLSGKFVAGWYATYQSYGTQGKENTAYDSQSHLSTQSHRKLAHTLPQQLLACAFGSDEASKECLHFHLDKLARLCAFFESAPELVRSKHQFWVGGDDVLFDGLHARTVALLHSLDGLEDHL